MKTYLIQLFDAEGHFKDFMISHHHRTAKDIVRILALLPRTHRETLNCFDPVYNAGARVLYFPRYFPGCGNRGTQIFSKLFSIKETEGIKC